MRLDIKAASGFDFAHRRHRVHDLFRGSFAGCLNSLGRARYKAKSSEKAEFTPVNEHFELDFNAVDGRVSRKATTCQGPVNTN